MKFGKTFTIKAENIQRLEAEGKPSELVDSLLDAYFLDKEVDFKQQLSQLKHDYRKKVAEIRQKQSKKAHYDALRASELARASKYKRVQVEI